MIRTHTITAALLLGLGAPLATRGAAAQGSRENADATLRATCRLATQVLTTGHPSPQYTWAAGVISGCDETGGQALANAWSAAPTDSVSLVRLAYSSRAMRDQRILTALTNLVAQATQPEIVRLTGLSVLASYVDSTVLVWADDLRHAPSMAILPTQSDVSSYATTAPFTSGAAAGILDTFRALAANETDPVIRGAARYLRDGFALRGP